MKARKREKLRQRVGEKMKSQSQNQSEDLETSNGMEIRELSQDPLIALGLEKEDTEDFVNQFFLRVEAVQVKKFVT